MERKNLSFAGFVNDQPTQGGIIIDDTIAGAAGRDSALMATARQQAEQIGALRKAVGGEALDAKETLILELVLGGRTSG